MDYEVPEWLRADRRRALRQKREKKMRARISAFFNAVILITAVSFFAWFCFWLYGWIGEQVEYVEMPVVLVPSGDYERVAAVVTAYTSSPDETWGDPFETASGARTGEGVIACPPKYPFGTQIVIEGRQYVCEDRMNRRYWNEERFDVWVETKHEAYQWGVRELLVKVAVI